MHNKRLKFWIGFGITCAVILVLVVVFCLAFRLKNVSVEFLYRNTESMIPANAQETAIELGEFDYGGNILFMDFESNIAKIEKGMPYVKVTQIVRYFPNRVKIYIVERAPRFRVQDKDDSSIWYILDEDFKVLAKVDDETLSSAGSYGSSSYLENTFEIDSSLLQISAEEGDFIEVDETLKSIMNNVASGIYGVNREYGSAYSITFDSDSDTITLTMRNSAQDDGMGCVIVIYGTDDLYNKVIAGVTVYETEIKDDSLDNSSQTVIYVYTNSTSGEIEVINDASENEET